MPGYFGPVPTWSPTFLPYPTGNQYGINIQNASYSFQHIMEPPTHISNTSSATSKIVSSDLDNRADGGESEAPLGSPLVEERTEEWPNPSESNTGNPLKSHNVQVVDDDTIEEPKSGMEFNSLEELLCYYKEYGKKCGFGVMTKRTDREENDSVRYVTLCCARGGKARNRMRDDEGDQQPDANRYSSLLSICYQMITHAAGSRKHIEDARSKLYVMIELYRANEEPPSFTQIGSNANDKTNDTTVGCSGEVHSPRVVRGKGRPPSLRRASRMEIDMRKAKAKLKKAPAKGKRKERDGVDTRFVDKGDTPVAKVCRSLFGPSEIDLSNVGHMQQAILSVGIDITTTQARQIVMQSQESMQVELDGSQLVHFGLDGSQPLQ